MDSSEEKDRIKSLEKQKYTNHHPSVSETKEIKKDVIFQEENIPHSKGIVAMYWMPIGIALGAALGVSMNRLSFWLPIGIVLGLLFSLASRKN